MPQHPYGWLSLLPPLVAIGLAIGTRRVIVSLLIGIVSGALILSAGHPLQALWQTAAVQLWPTLINRDRLCVFAFTLVMGAMVGLIHRAAGMRGLIQALWPWAKNRRRGQLLTWMLGLLLFFDDYANTLLLGNTLRPLCDRLKISREKLAYLVDSTAAPVAGLALISTWVASEIQFVRDGLDKLPRDLDWRAFDLFLHSLPYRFYVLWALVFVPLVAWFERDLGPMQKAESRAKAAEGPSGGRPEETSRDATIPDETTPARWYNAVGPIVVTVLSIVAFLYTSGTEALTERGEVSQATLWEIIGQADAFGSLVWGSLLGLATAVVLVAGQRLLAGRAMLAAIASGGRSMLPALIILWLASCLSAMTGGASLPRSPLVPAVNQSAGPSDPPDATVGEEEYSNRHYRLYTGDYLGELLSRRLPAWLLPTIIFLLSGAVAFATGTSWGTMGIVMPLAIPLAYGVLAGEAGPVHQHDPILLSVIGSVLAGAIFGDHCSPISDTTILSSQASGCDHVAHVWTQLPYALLVGVVSVLLGTLPIGLGVPVWVMLPLGIVVLIGALLAWGRRTNLSEES